MSRSNSEIIEPPNPLGKAKSGDGPVRIDPNILHRAEEAVEELNDEYSSWAQKDIDGLKAAVAAAASNPEELRNAIAEIYKRALDLKVQGGVFGYDLIASIGDLLTKFMEGRDTINNRDFAVISAHIDAMQAVIREDIKRDGGRIGFQIVDGLGELVQKLEGEFSTGFFDLELVQTNWCDIIRRMTVHILKLSVGIDSLSHLAERQRQRIVDVAKAGDAAQPRHLTRATPRRAEEVLDGGSIYWVIKGAIRGRQRIVGIDTAVNHLGLPRCALIFDPELVPVRARPHRPFQGWRYLEMADAPPDAVGVTDQSGDMPAEMAEELRALGLL